MRHAQNEPAGAEDLLTVRVFPAAGAARAGPPRAGDRAPSHGVSAAVAAAGAAAAGVASDTVSVPGSGLVFSNSYAASVTPEFHSCIVAAEQALATRWTNPVTITVEFRTVNQPGSFLASNSFNTVPVTYRALTQALGHLMMRVELR